MRSRHNSKVVEALLDSGGEATGGEVSNSQDNTMVVATIVADLPPNRSSEEHYYTDNDLKN